MPVMSVVKNDDNIFEPHYKKVLGKKILKTHDITAGLK